MQALKAKKLFMLDMDGTLYLDDNLFEHCLDFLQQIKKNGARYLFLTNNSSKSVSVYIDKLRRLGIEATANDFYLHDGDLCLFAGQGVSQDLRCGHRRLPSGARR